MTEAKAFAELALRFFSQRELKYIKNQTSCGQSALEVVRQALRDAANEHDAWIDAGTPDTYRMSVNLEPRRKRTFSPT